MMHAVILASNPHALALHKKVVSRRMLKDQLGKARASHEAEQPS